MNHQLQTWSFAKLVGSHDIVFVTLDTLRYDVAVHAMERGLTPSIQRRIPNGRWEHRHSPASFTYAAHQAFFSGFLPTPARPGKHPRRFAAKFLGSETTTDDTFCFEEPNIVQALRARDYYTICIGGVGFFNKQTELGNVLPLLFDESHWSENLSVACRDSTEFQVELAIERVTRIHNRPVFLFLNVSALHQPNYMYLAGADSDSDSIESQIAALAYVDPWLDVLWSILEKRSAGVCLICSDHGTAYGEEGYTGHRIGQACVWDVPFAEFCYAHSRAAP